MPTLNQVRTYVDQKLSDLWDYANDRQTIYAQNHGRYWQGLITRKMLRNHLPADPTVQEDDVLPDDQEYDQDGNPIHAEVIGVAGSHTLGWRGALPALPAKLPCVFQADEWQSPSGIGWKLTVWVKYDGTIYSRSRSRHEDDSITTEPWRVVDEF